CVFLHQHSTSSILHHSTLSLRQFFLSQGDTFSEHGIECQRILCCLDRVLLLFTRRVFFEKWQKHVAVFLVRLAVRFHIGNLLPGEAHFIHPFFRHPRRLPAAKSPNRRSSLHHSVIVIPDNASIQLISLVIHDHA